MDAAFSEVAAAAFPFGAAGAFSLGASVGLATEAGIGLATGFGLEPGGLWANAGPPASSAAPRRGNATALKPSDPAMGTVTGRTCRKCGDPTRRPGVPDRPLGPV